MRGLYEVYGKDKVLGHLWLGLNDLESMRQRGHIRVLIEDDSPLLVGPTPLDPTFKLEFITLWLDVRRKDGSYTYRIHSDASDAQLDKARRAQENNFRFPVPISLLPG